MKYRITGKQENSNNCIVCGLKNELGLKASFYELENGDVVAVFTSRDEHQSYPGRMHGGVAAGVTVELSLRYNKPIPLNEELKAVGRVIKDSRRLFEGYGEILLPNGEVAVSAVGKYMKMPIDKITNFDDLKWEVTATDSDPEFMEL